MDFEKLTFCWPAFGPDSGALVESVLSVREAAPGARCVVLEDHAQPVSDGAREVLDGLADFYVSEWDRGGNCNGLAHTGGLLAFWEFLAPAGGAVVNVDCDVVARDLSWLALHDWTRQPFGAVCQPSWWCQGATLGVSTAALPMLRGLLPRAEELIPHQGPRWPYDCTLGELAVIGLGAEGVAHWHGYPVGPFVAHYDYSSNAPFEGYGEFRTVNFGSRGLIRAPEAVKRGLVAETMRGFRAWLAGGGAVTQAEG